MTDERDQRYLSYIQDSIELIQRRTADGRAAFLNNVDAQDAVLWRLETLAEATGKLSQEIKDRHPHIRWRAVYGFRNIATHGYLGLQLDLVWEIIEIHLPSLKVVVDEELDRSRQERDRPQ
ncbi:MAG TPA: HepT-like ribonuclease domain-containing protein [Thermomicrobiaceae bacterium]|nr:HepT-like ribonuclease domain-containing protein [Thermomicrobiaceae bacterium]